MKLIIRGVIKMITANYIILSVSTFPFPCLVHIVYEAEDASVHSEGDNFHFLQHHTLGIHQLCSSFGSLIILIK